MGVLNEKVALITGGNSGIGLAGARLFAAEGARVHLVGRDEATVKAAVKEIGPEQAMGSVADVTDEAAVAAVVAEGAAQLGGYDVLFSNAGNNGDYAKITDYSSEMFARTLQIHVLGAFHMIKHTVPCMRDGGSIIITSSVAGMVGFGDLSAYVAAKHGQVGLMRSAAKELAERRIRVNTLNPGPTSTLFQSEVEVAATGQDAEAAAKMFDGMIPLGRHNSPEEVAQAALYLASDASAMVTSTTFKIDGGIGG